MSTPSLVALAYLTVIGSGKNRGYIAGHKYTSTKSGAGLPVDNYNNTLYAVDFSSGAVRTYSCRTLRCPMKTGTV